MDDEKKDETKVEEVKPESEEPEEKKKDDEPEKKYTDKEVDDIVNKKFAKWKKEAEEKIAAAKAEGEKLAKMNEDQKRQYEAEKREAEFKKLQDENEALKKEAARAELSKEAANILKESEIDATQDILDFVVADDAETTKANIEKFVDIIKSQVKAAEVKRAKGRTPQAFNNESSEPDPFAKHLAKYKK